MFRFIVRTGLFFHPINCRIHLHQRVPSMCIPRHSLHKLLLIILIFALFLFSTFGFVDFLFHLLELILVFHFKELWRDREIFFVYNHTKYWEMRIILSKRHFLIPECHLELNLLLHTWLWQEILSDMQPILLLNSVPMLAFFPSLVGLDHFYLSFDFIVVNFVNICTLFTFTIFLVAFWLFLCFLGKLL